MVKYVACLEGLTFTPSVLYKGKDEVEATKQRTLGNEAFQKRDYQKAFFYYTVSIIKAEYPSHEDKVMLLSLLFMGPLMSFHVDTEHHTDKVTDW